MASSQSEVFKNAHENVNDCLKDHVELSVPEAEKRPNGAINIREYFTVYLIDVKVTDDTFTKVKTRLGSTWRRYTDFEQLRNYLEETYPYLIVPPLPEKKVNYTWSKVGADTTEPEFVDRRRIGLELFLSRVASHPSLCYDAVFLGFLQHDDSGWRDACKNVGRFHGAETTLRGIAEVAAGTGTLHQRIQRRSCGDERFEAIRDAANEMQSQLTQLLRMRAKLADCVYVIHKVHANYGRLFSEWSAIEKSAIGDGLQQSGHFMDSIAQGVDSILEDEEIVIDLFKEYLFYCNSIQSMCKRHELLTMELDRAAHNVEVREGEKDQIVKGKTSLLTRLLGSVDSDEVRESKINTLDKKIQDGRTNLKTTQEELTDFKREALLDYDRFQAQKAKDVKLILQRYAESNIRLSKQALNAWSSIKASIDNIL